MVATNISIRRRSGRPLALIVASKVLGVISLDSLVGIFLAGALFLSLKGALTGEDGTARDASANNGRDVVIKSDGSTESVVTVAYAVSVTGCGSDPITEGGAVLQHSIHRVSRRGLTSGGRYDYALFAIYHPDAEACALPLQELGYTLLKRDTPVAVADIEGEFLRTKIEANGCCGEKELIKLEAYTLIDYPIVVHLDLDVLVLKPLDSLFDLMLGRPVDAAVQAEIFMWKDKSAVGTIDAFFTMDYNMVPPSVEYKPVQGGFLVTRPSMAVYEEYREIVRKGDFQQGKGWGGKVGPFHGSMTFQGIIPYYYNVLHKGTSIELNRCIFNQMCDNPRTGRTVDDVVSGECRTGEKDCQDCRTTELDKIVTTHYTLCQKPWWCLPHDQNAIQHRLCRKLTHEWYSIRSDLELSWGRQGKGPGTFAVDIFHGYCKMQGKHGYIPIEQPYGDRK